MSDQKLPRLLAAAKEFNVGQDTLIEFLATKGFPKDDLKPTSKLTDEQYTALQREFQGDKVAKQKSDQIDLPKGNAEAKKRKEEEAAAAAAVVTVKKEESKAEEVEKQAVETETPVVAPTPPKTVEPVVAQPEEKAPAVVEQPKAPEAPLQKPVEEKPKEVAVPKPAPQAEAPAPEVEKPKVEHVAPKVGDKIDLSAIDSSTRPKKQNKPAPKPQPEAKKDAPAPKPAHPPKQHKPQQEAPKPNPAPKPQPKVEIKQETPVVPPTVDAGNEEPVIENIKVDRLEGPKILGRIELPVNSDTRPKREDKRKRKRIPVEKKGDNVGGGQQQGGQQNRPGGNQQQGGGNRPGGGNYQGNRPGGNQQQGGGGNRPGGNQQGGGNRPGGGNYQGNRPGGGNRNRPGGNRNQQNGPNRQEDRVIDQKEIQEKLRQTQAKLAGAGNKGRSIKSKQRRERRAEMAELEGQEQDMKLQVTEFISVSELANLMDVSFAEVISKCMGLGIMVSINQRLDAEVIELVAEEFGYEVEFIDMEAQLAAEETEEVDAPEDLSPRAPIVTIMGHVDHGKTSLLDYIRNANVVSGEAGGITQHIGAYEVKLPSGKKIAFLDTPGHEAFTAMRARGAKVTDIAVIVVAADDAVMPQTREAISHAQAAGVPMIFAVNKIDKDGANPQKIYEQLSQMNILVEEWGGKFQSQELSAKKGLNIDLLLEKILLEAEMLELKANPNRLATGTIVESLLDKGRGYVTTVLVQNGTLNIGDIMVTGQFYGRVKAMANERGQRMTKAGPSTPVQVLGLNGAPQAGEKFKIYAEESEAKEIANKRAQIIREQGLRTRKHITLDEIGRRLALGNFKELNLIIKGDVDGSVEALTDSLQKLSTDEIAVRVVHKGVGQISESDVLLATASDAIVVGFNVRPSSQANKLAENEGVQIKNYSIIYNAIEEIKSAMEGMLEPKIQEKEVATIEIREVFKFDKATVAGCYVAEGRVKRDAKLRIYRDGILLYPRQEGAFAELASLKRYKDDAKEVIVGQECGLTIKNYADIQVGDTIVAYEEEEVKRTL